MELKHIAYFLIGGFIVTLSTYFGSKGHGLTAAFFTQFPAMSVLSFLLIYHAGGKAPVIQYARGFFCTIPAWILYISTVVFFCDRIGIWWSLLIGVSLYIGTSTYLMSLK